MEHKVLYRKYRPNNFGSIIGQDIIIKTLKNAIVNNKVSHAYIFSGPRGTGKTSTAKVFAKALNCMNYDDGPCNKCDSCLNFSTNPDIIEIDAASNNGVDDVRELINNVRLAPSMSKYKVYIIDEVHMLTTNAFNALLLTLEEPPKNVVFIFATTNIENVPITILSRCQRFDFSQISIEYLTERLKYVISEEKIVIDDDAINEICILSEGGLRDALSILDQLSSQNSKITLETVQNNFNIIGKKFIESIVEFIKNNKKNELLELIDVISQKGYDFKNVIKRLIEELIQELVNETMMVEIVKKIILELNNLLNNINIYVNPYVLLKTVLLSYMISPDEISYLKVSEKEKNIENDSGSLKNEEIEEKNYFPGNNFEERLEQIIKLRINNTFVNPTKKDLQENQKNWQILQKNIKDANLLSLLVDTKISASSENHAIITADLEAVTHLINVSINKIENEFNNICKKDVKLICVTTEKWTKLKQEYAKNTKNNIKYTFVKEPDLEYNDEALINIADDVFRNVKIEME